MAVQALAGCLERAGRVGSRLGNGAAHDRLPTRGDHHNVVSPGNYFDWREQAISFVGIGARNGPFPFALTGTGEPARVEVSQISSSAWQSAPSSRRA